MPDILLTARGITKQWPGVLALDRVDFNIYAGCVNALVGENGAGKSTLMNILSGVYSDYEGEVSLMGRPVHFKSTEEAFQSGIAIVHQELNLIPELDIAENIFLGRELLTPLGTLDYKAMRREAEQLLQRLGFPYDTHKKIRDLKVGEQQMVEIAKAFSVKPRILILDEPTSSLTDKETAKLFEILHRLRKHQVGVVYISHKMDELRQIADYVTVLRDGRLIGEHPAADLDTDEIVRLMVGHKANDFYTHTEREPGEALLSIDLPDCAFSVRRGEVLGLYGLMGAGRTELLETLFGLRPDFLARGKVTLDGQVLHLRSPKDAIDAGIALIPEERKTDGLVLGMDITRNLTLPSLDRFKGWFGLNESKENDTANQFRALLDIKSHSAAQLAGELSGGNQQKVVLAKWLFTEPRVLLLDEPTRGIDIGAKSEIYKLIDRLAEQGMTILVASSELPEIMAISDRIVTLCEGRKTGEFLHRDFSQERILSASLPK